MQQIDKYSLGMLYDYLERRYKPIQPAPSDADIGKLLFGSTARIELGIWIRGRGEDAGAFCAADATGALNRTRGNFQHTLSDLCRLGMLSRHPTDSGPLPRPVYYRAEESPLWEIIDATTRALVQIETVDEG